MEDFAIFTEEIALALIARGFRLKGYSDKAWFFEGGVSLERAVSELVAALEYSSK